MDTLTRKVLIVGNHIKDWSTISSKLEKIKELVGPRRVLTFDFKETAFSKIPFVPYTNGGEAGATGAYGVDQIWYDQNVSIFAKGYDFVVFHYTPDEAHPLAATGWRTDSTYGAIELQICCFENETLTRWNSQTNSNETIDKFTGLFLHEYGHGECMLLGVRDFIHEIWGIKTVSVFPLFWEYLKNAPPLTPVPNDNTATLKKYIQDLLAKVAELIKKRDELKADLLNKFCLAIQKHEGFYYGSRSYRNNNSGNLKFVGQLKAIGQDDKGFAVFNTYQDGFNELKNMILRASKGQSKVYNSEMTISQFFNVYAPPTENDTNAYAKFVAKQLGVDANVFKIKYFV